LLMHAWIMEASLPLLCWPDQRLPYLLHHLFAASFG